MYKIADSTLEMMKREEGFRGSRYADGWENGVQKYSIGYGHQIQPGEIFIEPISEAKATELLKKDLSIRLPNLNKVLPSGLTQRQFDQLFSYSMSFGTVRILEARLYKLIKDFAPMKEVRDWWLSSYVTVGSVPSTGLKKRRERQVAAFFSDPYPPLNATEKYLNKILFAVFVLLFIYLIYLILSK